MAHPAKYELVPVEAVSVTDAPAENVERHTPPQLMPVGELVTVPRPLPPLDTDIVNGPLDVYVAITVLYEFIVTVQVLAVEHPPPVHPTNEELVAALEWSTTTVPGANDWVTLAPDAQPLVYAQSIDPVELVTVPSPFPCSDTANTGSKLAVTLRAPSMTIAHWSKLLGHPFAPPHPANTTVLPGISVRVTVDPAAKLAEHVELPLPQLIPAEEDVTDAALAGPAVERVSVNVAFACNCAKTRSPIVAAPFTMRDFKMRSKRSRLIFLAAEFFAVIFLCFFFDSLPVRYPCRP